MKGKDIKRKIQWLLANPKEKVDPEIEHILQELQIKPTGSLESDILAIEQVFDLLRKQGKIPYSI